jgi:hypothetical protein
MCPYKYNIYFQNINLIYETYEHQNQKIFTKTLAPICLVLRSCYILAMLYL